MFITCEPMVQYSSVRPFWKAYNVRSNIGYLKHSINVYAVRRNDMKLSEACPE